MITPKDKYFSLPDTILATFAHFQPLYEDKNLRLKMEIDLSCPSYWPRESEPFIRLLHMMLSEALQTSKKGLIHVFFSYHSPFLTAVLNGGATLEYRISVEYNTTPIENDTELPLPNMVVVWQLKDIEMSDLVVAFVLSLPERLTLMQHAINTLAIDQLRDTIHAMKGITGTFKMTELYEPLVEMDNLIKGSEALSIDFFKAYKSLQEVYSNIPQKYFKRPE